MRDLAISAQRRVDTAFEDLSLLAATCRNANCSPGTSPVARSGPPSNAATAGGTLAMYVKLKKEAAYSNLSSLESERRTRHLARRQGGEKTESKMRTRRAGPKTREANGEDGDKPTHRPVFSREQAWPRTAL
jgi:hypothetical protein